MDDWLVRHVAVLGISFQNWMVVTFALVLIGALISWGEKGRKG
jgi:hypothetical protein